MSHYKYSIHVLGAILFSEVAFIIVKKIYRSVFSVSKDMNCDEAKTFSQVVFFPDQGIIGGCLNDERLLGSVNNSPCMSILPADPKNGLRNVSVKDYDCKVTETHDISPHTSTLTVDPKNGPRKVSMKDSHHCKLTVDTFGSVNVSPHSSTLTADQANSQTEASVKDYNCNIAANTFFPPNFKLSVTNGYLKRSSSLIHMIQILESAKMSLMLCLHSLSSKDLIDAILRAKARGVHVRVLLDSEMGRESCERTMDILHQYHIFVRPSRPPHMMHHKFALIDAYTNTQDTGQLLARNSCSKSQEILMTGSFNWTWSAIVSNHENVLITSHPLLIQHFAREFEALWQRDQYQETRQFQVSQDIICDASSAIYFQAIFFPDQGILNSGCSMADFGSVNNSPVPSYPLYPIANEDRDAMRDSKATDIPFHLQPSRAKDYMRDFCNARDIPYSLQPSRALSQTIETPLSPQHLSTLRHSTSLIQMIKVLDSAKESLLVCLHTLTCRDLINAIVRAQLRGVSVRVLVDGRMWEESCQKTMTTFQQHKVPFLPSFPPLMLHHKFAVIDPPLVSLTSSSVSSAPLSVSSAPLSVSLTQFSNHIQGRETRNRNTMQETGNERTGQETGNKWTVQKTWDISTVRETGSKDNMQKPCDNSVVPWRIRNIWNFGSVYQFLSLLRRPQNFLDRLTGVLKNTRSRQLKDIWNSFSVPQFLSQFGKPQKPQERLTGVLMTGSFNWTRRAVIRNHENVVITNDPILVQHYAQEFESLWASCLDE